MFMKVLHIHVLYTKTYLGDMSLKSLSMHMFMKIVYIHMVYTKIYLYHTSMRKISNMHV